MKESTRRRKEEAMLNAAIRIMKRKGLTNFTMDHVAKEAEVTKVTLYTYFTSKENLTMAVCYHIYGQIRQLVDQTTIEFASSKGLETCMEIKAKILAFLAEDPFRSSIIMEIISVYNMPNEKLSSAMAESTFRVSLNNELEDLTNLLIGAVEKGRKDGSIRNKAPNEMLIVYLWNCLSGFITIISSPGFQHRDAHDFLEEMGSFHEKFARVLLSNP